MADHMAVLPSLPFSSRTFPSLPRDSAIGQYSAESRSLCTSAVQYMSLPALVLSSHLGLLVLDGGRSDPPTRFSLLSISS